MTAWQEPTQETRLILPAAESPESGAAQGPGLLDQLLDLLSVLRDLLPTLVTVVVVVFGLVGARILLQRQSRGKADTEFRLELTMFVLTLFGLVAVLLALPVSEGLRAQLLSLFGLLLSAAIALSATTFLGNMMAGLMLRAVRSFKTGDFLRCGKHFGRVTERGLLHTELQTEDSDLTTLPNLHLVTTPYSVIRASGTIITATVSLGYDVSRHRIEELLLQAAADVELDQPFVHVIELGDFSVVYRVGGMLKEVKQLLSTRSKLRCRMLDRLHEAEIEIASPTMMSTRSFEQAHAFVPPIEQRRRRKAEKSQSLEDLAFEKADQAATVEELVARVALTDEQLIRTREERKKAKTSAEKKAFDRALKVLVLRAERQARLLNHRQEELAKRDADGK